MANELTPAIPREEVYPGLEVHVSGPTKTRAFRQDDEFRSFRYRFQQITPVLKFFEQHCQLGRTVQWPGFWAFILLL
jgi:hypothetical protein